MEFFDVCYIIRKKHREKIFFITFDVIYDDFYYEYSEDLEKYLLNSNIPFEEVLTYTKNISYSFVKNKVCISKRV